MSLSLVCPPMPGGVMRQVELTACTTELTECKKELAVRPAVEDVSRLRQQLSLLQTLYFNADDAESPSATPSGTPVTAGVYAAHSPPFWFASSLATPPPPLVSPSHCSLLSLALRPSVAQVPLSSTRTHMCWHSGVCGGGFVG